ncbi:MAG: arylamine N-acetyltransferase [Rhizobiaceae bacterium]
MNLDHYLQRIGFRGVADAGRETLDALMAAHVNTVTFENLNQQLGQPVTMDLADIYQKIVAQQRGGWCFELNSLFGWALTELGFDVDYLAGQVGRSEFAPEFLANHMLLRVKLDQPMLVDVGYGCGLTRSIPLSPNEQKQSPYVVSITQLNDGYNRYCEFVRGEPGTYDFTLEPVDRAYFEAASHRLQTDPESPFLRTLTAQLRHHDKHMVLRGLVLRTVAHSGSEEVLLTSKGELVRCLLDVFGLDKPEIADLWPKLQQRHEELFGSN